MRFASWMAIRYLSARKDQFLRVINFVALAGIAIGVGALIIVIAVMSGFDHDLREKIIGANAHVLIERETGLRDPEKIQERLKAIEGIKAQTPYVHGNVFLETGTRAMSLIVRGVLPATEAGVTKIDSYLKDYQINQLQAKEVVIGSQLAAFYDYKIGDTITLIAPASGVAGQKWRYPLTIKGIFTSGMYDYDMNLILIHLTTAQQIFNLDNNVVSGIGLKLVNPDLAFDVKRLIYEVIGFSVLVKTWQESNANFFAALQLEKFAMFVILTLIVLVASFNIVSTLIVTVTSKIKDIGILKAIGASNGMINRMFMWQGIIIGLKGICWGLLMGVGLSLLLKKYHFIELPQDIYYIKHLPVLLNPVDIAIIVASAMMITFVASCYPAWKASRLQPVDALRY